MAININDVTAIERLSDIGDGKFADILVERICKNGDHRMEMEKKIYRDANRLRMIGLLFSVIVISSIVGGSLYAAYYKFLTSELCVILLGIAIAMLTGKSIYDLISALRHKKEKDTDK